MKTNKLSRILESFACACAFSFFSFVSLSFSSFLSCFIFQCKTTTIREWRKKNESLLLLRCYHSLVGFIEMHFKIVEAKWIHGPWAHGKMLLNCNLFAPCRIHSINIRASIVQCPHLLFALRPGQRQRQRMESFAVVAAWNVVVFVDFFVAVVVVIIVSL